MSEQKRIFAHSGNLLIATLADDRQSVRLRALSLISDVPGPHKETNFVLPQVNPNAKDYTGNDLFEI